MIPVNQRKACLKYALAILSVFFYSNISAQQPVADFTAGPISGCAPLTVHFINNSSSSSPAAFNWNLGNGTISAIKDPVTTYFSPGLYSVALTVTNADGKDSITKTAYIKIYGKPAVAFSVNDSTGCIPLVSQFTDASTSATGSVTGWEWDFGDGDTSTQQHPLHSYLSDGIFNVTLKVTNTGGCVNAISKRQYITVAKPPSAAFALPVTVKCKPPETINFNNLSTGNGNLKYLWDFGNGTTSTQRNPASIYTTAGSFSVQLIVTDNAGCADTTIKKDSVVINTVTSSINATDSVCTGTAAAMINSSFPMPLTAKWTFGDGTFANAISGSKSWNTPGVYTITLTNTYPACTDTVSKIIRVLSVPGTKFSASDSSTCNAPFAVDFNDLTAGATQWDWQFGDGSISALQNPSHVYSSTGAFNVKLTAANAFGCAKTVAYNNFIKVLKPVARISNAPAGGCIPFIFKPVSGSSSAEGISSYLWDFGNGSTSAMANPTAFYSSAGTYTIKLIVTSNDGCLDSISIADGIKTNTKPVVDFSVSPAAQCYGAPVNFTDQSVGPIERWLWFTGDSSSATTQYFQHVYKDTGTFTVKLIAWQNGCSDTVIKRDIVKNKVPIARFKSSFNCANRLEVTFTDTSAMASNWLWDFGDGTTSAVQHPVHQFSSSKSYNVKLTVWNDTCSNSITKPVTVLDSKPDFSSPKNSICKNDSVQLKVITSSTSPLDKYTWVFGDGQSSTGYSTAVSHKYTAGGNYTVSLFTKETNGCFDTIVKTSFVQVFAPKANFSISAATGCKPMQVWFSDNCTTANGVNNLATWEWTFTDGQSQISHTKNAVPMLHLYSDTGYFKPYLKITDSIGCTDKFVLPLALYVSKPAARFDSLPVITCIGKPVRLSNTSSGKNISSHWVFGDGDTSNVSNPDKSFTTEGDYSATLVVTDGYGCTDFIEKINYFNVREVIPSFLLDDSTGTCVPFKVTFTNTAQFANGQSWDFGDGSTSTLQNPVHFYNDPGTYYPTLTAKRGSACFATVSKKVEIYAPSGMIDYQPLYGCSPLAVSFTVNTAASVSYIYDFNDGTSIESSNAALQHTYLLPGKFLPKVILKDSTGCLIPVFGKDTIRLYNSTVNFGSDKTILCDSGIIVFSDSTISGSPVSSYNWTFGDGSSSSVRNPAHQYSATGLYTVGLNIKTIYGCTDTLIKPRLIKVVVKPRITMSGNNSFCGPSSVSLQSQLLSSDTSAINWLWQYGNGHTATIQNPGAQQYDAIGNYVVKLTATNSNGCTDSAGMVVSINPFPATNAGNDTFSCLNSITTLHASGADFYAWQPSALLNCSDCADPVARLQNNTAFILNGVTNAGCQKADTITVRVKKPFSITKPQALDTICAGDKVQLVASGAERYNWYPALGLSDPTIGNPLASPDTTTIYKLVATDSSNCFRDSAFAKLIVFPKAMVNAGPDIRLAYGKSVSINTQYSGGVVKWSWSPSQYLTCTNCPNPVAKPLFNTTYTVTVSNAAGCSATDEVKLLLTCDKNNLFLPAAFTPNGDNLNDVFYPISVGVFKIKSFRIFDRNGKLVFFNASFLPNVRSAGWDGKINGIVAATGSYMYSLEIICNNAEELNFSGNILLLK